MRLVIMLAAAATSAALSPRSLLLEPLVPSRSTALVLIDDAALPSAPPSEQLGSMARMAHAHDVRPVALPAHDHDWITVALQAAAAAEVDAITAAPNASVSAARANLTDALCSATESAGHGYAGDTTAVYILLLVCMAFLVLDILDAPKIMYALGRVLMARLLNRPLARPEPTGRPGDHDAFCDTTPTTPSGGSERGLVPSDLHLEPSDMDSAVGAGAASSTSKRKTDASAGDDDDAPRSVDLRGWVTIVLTSLPSFAGDVHFSMLAPFLPGAADARGLSSVVIGLLFAGVPIGAALAALCMPAVLAHASTDPFVLLRRATIVHAALVACAGLAGNLPVHPLQGVPFATVIFGLRLFQGVACACVDVCSEATNLRILPRSFVGPVSGVVMAVRILAVIAGPVIGGALYQKGCWALPFTAGAASLAAAALVVTIGLGGTAPPSLKPRGDEKGTLELLRTYETWLVALPTLVLSMVAAFLEPTWQLFLGAPPFNLSPKSVGVFLQLASLEYLVVLVLAGFMLPCIGAALQMMLGCLACATGLLLLGPSPLLRGAVPQTWPVVLIGTMITFGGIGTAIPALTPMALEVYARNGFSQKQVAGAAAALFTALINAANVAGPLLGGALKGTSGGLPLATTLYCLIGGSVSVACCARLLLVYVRRPGAGCCARR